MSELTQFHQDLASRLNDHLEIHEPDTDPAIWAVRACAAIVYLIGQEKVDFEEVRGDLERIFVMAPDKVIEATVLMNEINQGDIK